MGLSMNMQFKFVRPEITEIFCDEDKSNHPEASTEISPVRIERHQEREILIPLDGAFTFFFGENTFHAERGMAFLIDSWGAHSSGYQITMEEQVQLWIHFHPKNIYATLLKIVAGDPLLSEWTSAELPFELLALISRRWNMLENPQLSPELAKTIRRSIVETVLDELEFLNNYQVNNSGAHLDPVKFIKRYVESTHGCNCVFAVFENTTGYDRSFWQGFQDKNGNHHFRLHQPGPFWICHRGFRPGTHPERNCRSARLFQLVFSFPLEENISG